MRFIFIDRILELEKGRSIRALKNVAMSEDIFEDHFPGFPVLPGALILESFDEASTFLIEATEEYAILPTLGAVRNAKFRRFVRPGTQLVVEARLTRPGETRCRASADGREVARADLEFSTVACPPGTGYLARLYELSLLLRSIE